MHAASFAIHTLGCKLNYAESSSLARQLACQSMTLKKWEEEADIYILNTCSVTQNADKECRQIIEQIHRKFPASFVVVVGCFAQLKPQDIANIPGVDLVLGAAEKFNLPAYLGTLAKTQTQIHGCALDDAQDFVAAFSYQGRTRSFLKIQDGCDYTCSYCTIPMARGKSRSGSAEHIRKSAQILAEKGIKEIVLTGVNIGDYGTVAKKRAPQALLHLLRNLDQHTDIPRYRISSIEPNLLTNDIIRFVASSAHFMPHFHIPLQSGSDKILALMRRRYQKKLYENRIRYIQQFIPDCAIGADVIVGFPGESDADFEETYQFLSDLSISYLHVFTYSERAGTEALNIQPSVPLALRKERNKRLRLLSMEKQETFKRRFTGTTRAVLFEQGDAHKIEGYTDNYIKVSAAFKADLENQIIDWKLC